MSTYFIIFNVYQRTIYSDFPNRHFNLGVRIYLSSLYIYIYIYRPTYIMSRRYNILLSIKYRANRPPIDKRFHYDYLNSGFDITLYS